MHLSAHQTLLSDWSVNTNAIDICNNCSQAVCYWTALGYRVLGMIAGRVLAESRQDLSKLNLVNITQHTYGMRLLGFAVVSNPLRCDATAAITELQDR